MTIWLSFVLLVISVYIKDASGWPKFLLRAGFVMFVLLLVPQVSIFHALCVMLREEPWKEPTFISIQIFGNRQILGFMSIRKSVHITSKNSNIPILKKFSLKVNKTKTKIIRTNKNFIMITSINLPIHKTSPVAITFGYIMFVQYGFLNVTLSKKMELLMWKEFKILKKNDTNINVLYVKNLKPELMWNVKIQNAENIIIPNAREKRRYIWSN